ncbi:MAG: (2Fe-2S) ferredoxin domain-containing protein [Oscillospiraceae bacterium]
MEIYVCVGSSCHLKGSQKVIGLMKAAIAEHHLTETVKLAAAFCCGKCTENGVSIRIDSEVYCGITEESFAAFFRANVLGRLLHPNL